MHIIYKQDFYNNKESEIYDLFVEYLVPIMENIDHPELIEELKQNLDAAAYEKNLYKYVKLPSTKKKMDRNDKTEYCPTSIKESINWLPFFDIMEFTADRIENYKNILPSLLKIFQCLRLNVGGIRGNMR